jgi:type II secretion system protein I
MIRRTLRGFTLIEVMVALAVVAIGLAALMTAVSSTAGASGYLRQKAQAQWIALNRLVEVRLNLQNFGAGLGTGTTTGLGSSGSGLASTGGGGLGGTPSTGSSTSGTSGTSTDTGELDFANQHWHYDTQYFDTSIATMRRVVVRVYAGTADTKGPALAEATGFIGTAVATPGSSNNTNWTDGTSATAPGTGANGATKPPGTALPPAGSAAAGGLGGLGGLGGQGGLGSQGGLGGQGGLGDGQSGNDGTSGDGSTPGPNGPVGGDKF